MIPHGNLEGRALIEGSETNHVVSIIRDLITVKLIGNVHPGDRHGFISIQETVGRIVVAGSRVIRG